MTITFTVETGEADPDANSYTDLGSAGDYISCNSYQSAAWAALDDTTQQFYLIRSSKMLDARFDWVGEKVDESSGLRWPRHNAYDRDGFMIQCDMIPQALMDATAEFATYLMSDDWTAPSTPDQFRELRVDVIDIKYNTDYRRGYLPDTVIQLLVGLGSGSNGKRPAFKRITRY